MNFTAKIEITPQQIADLMVTAFEGGITYWCKSAFLMSEEPDASTLTSEELKDPWYARPSTWAGEFKVDFHDKESDTVWTLDRAKVQAAFGTALSAEDVSLFSDENGYDAGDADVIVQKMLFGEIVYG